MAHSPPFWSGDKSLTAVYVEHVLLPKRVTDSFYVKMMRCYEELFEASLTTKLSLAMKAGADNASRRKLLADQFAKLDPSDASFGDGVIGTYTPRSHSFSVCQDHRLSTIEKNSHSDAVKFRSPTKSFSAKPQAKVELLRPPTRYHHTEARHQMTNRADAHHRKQRDTSNGSYEIKMYKTHDITSL